MGLDMYAYRAKKEQTKADESGLNVQFLKEDGSPIDGENEYFSDFGIDTNFWYWRKVNFLEGYFSDLYEARGGEGNFNCEHVLLDEYDIADLRAVALNTLATMHEDLKDQGVDYMNYTYGEEWNRWGDFNVELEILQELPHVKFDDEVGVFQPCEGFFFGPAVITPSDLRDVLNFCDASDLAFENGEVVVYHSWW